jgi:two-component system response regulator AtoC
MGAYIQDQTNTLEYLESMNYWEGKRYPETPAQPADHGSSYLRQVDPLLRQISGSDVPVLLQGETGVGKEVVARRIHAYSRRANKPLVKVNCAALPSELVESELFGCERGAFTGAYADRPGRFELAQGGTILLDEIGDMDVRLQAKLLQVLQDSEFSRLGSREIVRLDLRFMAATHQDLRKAIQEGRFREDLYYRLNVISIKIPPIRERKHEIPGLVKELLAKHASPDTAPPPITPALERAFLRHDWPGNVRELENTVRRYLVLRDPNFMIQELEALHKTASVSVGQEEETPVAAPPQRGSVLRRVEQMKQEAERSALLEVLETTRWNRKRAAALLQIDYKVFLYKMKKLGLNSAPSLPSGTAQFSSLPTSPYDNV